MMDGVVEGSETIVITTGAIEAVGPLGIMIDETIVIMVDLVADTIRGIEVISDGPLGITADAIAVVTGENTVIEIKVPRTMVTGIVGVVDSETMTTKTTVVVIKKVRAIEAVTGAKIVVIERAIVNIIAETVVVIVIVLHEITDDPAKAMAVTVVGDHHPVIAGKLNLLISIQRVVPSREARFF